MLGSAATDLRECRSFNFNYFHSSFLNLKMKKKSSNCSTFTEVIAKIKVVYFLAGFNFWERECRSIYLIAYLSL